MFRPAPMKKFYLTIYSEKEAEIIEALGKIGFVQLIKEYAGRTPPKAEELRIYASYKRLLEKAKSLSALLAPEEKKKPFPKILLELFMRPEHAPRGIKTGLSLDEISSYLSQTESEVDKLTRLKEIGEEITELKMFSLLEKKGISPDSLGDYEHVFVKAGKINKVVEQKLPELTEGMSVTYEFVPWSTTDELFVISGQIEDRSRAEEILSRLNFEELKPSYAIKSQNISEQLAEGQKEEETLKKELLKITEEFSKRSFELEPIMRTIYEREQAIAGISKVESFSVIHGWVPKAELDRFEKVVKKSADDKFVLDIEDPSPNEEPPIMIRSSGVVKYFDPIIQIWGRPNYHEINPTPIVTLLFLIMFGMMFGDVGQGAVFAVLGYALARGRSERLQKIGGMLAICGISAIIFGFLYGTFFLAEILHPLFFRPLNDIPLIIKIAFVFGVTQITLGIIINIVNKAVQRNRASLLGGIYGIAGLVFYLGFISLVFLSGLSIGKVGQNLAVLVVTLVALGVIIVTPVLTSFSRKESLSKGALESFREMVELPTTFVANSVSYLRIAALALIHGAFSLLAISLTAGFGVLLALPIYFVLNLLVLVLEGLIVSVQALRLIYYEFFSKFYSGRGTQFSPFKIKLD
jgi:V/A-type H+-transporting ATPase subunit I